MMAAGSVFAATKAGGPAPPALLLGVQNGLANENQVAMDNAAQTLADVIGAAAGRKVIWEAHFSAKDAAPQTSGSSHYDFAFVKPPNLTALLLTKGWKLVATAKDPVGFGTDLIAQPCPGKPGQVLLGGPGLSILGLSEAQPATCATSATVWNSPAAVLLIPAKGSLVDKMASKLWLQHASALPKIVHVGTQNAVTGLMQDMHAPAIGVVTPLVSKKWVAGGGVLLQHQPMPFWAVLAAPDTPPDMVGKVGAALLSPAADRANKALHIPGWNAGDPKPYIAFLQWLNAK